MKKMTLLLLGMTTFVSTAFGAVKITEERNSLNYFFSVDAINTQTKQIEGQNFQIASLAGVDGYTGIRYEIGEPEVPVLRLMVSADKASDINIVSTELKSFKAYSLTNELKPVMDSVEKIPGSIYKIVKNKSFRSRMAYPATSFEVVAAGSIRGQKQFMVTLYPVEYIGATNTLRIARTYNVEVKSQINKSQTSAEGIVFVIGKKFKSSPSLENYIDVKKNQGMNVYRLDMENNVPAETTRARLKDLYKTNSDLRFAVIIGDAEDVPGKDSDLIGGLTDHYFSSIDTDNYEADINTPDIAVGRISVTNEEQLSAVLRKYTRYIKGEFNSNNWINDISFLATDDREVIAEGSHNYVIDTHTAGLGYSGVFPNANQAGGDKLYAITYKAGNKEVMSAITKGRSIINYSGHGAITYWDAPRVSQADVRTLNSTAASLPFVISNACITGDYRVPESFAETWQRQEWGAIMFWGSMDSTYWDEDDILERRMYDGIFTLHKNNFGEITHHALAEMWKAYGGKGRSAYYWETYIMFGDPSIDLRLR
jgi:hypothetical protein